MSSSGKRSKTTSICRPRFPFPLFLSLCEKDASAFLSGGTLTGLPCGHATALRPMEELADLRIIHHRGFYHVHVKFPAMHVFMFHAWVPHATGARRHCWIIPKSAYKRNMKARDQNRVVHPYQPPNSPTIFPIFI